MTVGVGGFYLLNNLMLVVQDNKVDENNDQQNTKHKTFHYLIFLIA